MSILSARLLLAVGLLTQHALAETPIISFANVDARNGRDINEVCAGCHGEFGAGGKEGEYPRLAGQPAPFVAKQLLLFRDRSRENLAMVEYVDHRQMPDPDIADVSTYLATIELKTKLPPVDETAPGYNAYQRLQEAKRLMQIPLADGDAQKGRRLYKKECGSCHGREGWGDADKVVPMLAGQYTSYLWRQVDRFIEGQRIHDGESPQDELLKAFSKEEIRDIFAYLSTVDD
jgi:cytochrome c553